MMDARDRELGMDRSITRRDFLNGAALTVGAAVGSAWMTGCGRSGEAPSVQTQPGYNPSADAGMRGSHGGSFEVAHQLRDGTFWQRARAVADTGEAYDLVVVGAGISGLAAAYFHRKRAGASARILILDNHDDFGGHAKRNEFRVGGRVLISNGGTLLVSSPFAYSKEARGLMDDLGIDPAALAAKCNDRQVFRGLQSACFFDRETFGADRLVVGAPGAPAGRPGAMPWKDFLSRTPLSPEAQRDIAGLEESDIDYLPGLSSAEKKDRLSRISYENFLLKIVGVHPDVVPFYQTRTLGLMGVGIDAFPALDCWALNLPGFRGMKLDPGAAPRMCYTARGEITTKEPYTFHHPDGMASIARQLVRTLVPGAVSGQTAEDIVTARVDYGRLDLPGAPTRIRLNSTAVRVRHLGAPESAKEVEVSYQSGGRCRSVRGRGVVLACWNSMIPYLCPELPAAQKEALAYGVKVPLVYTHVAIRNWTAFKNLGIQRISSPGMYHISVAMDQPVNIGDYRCPQSPEEPMVLFMTRVPCQPGLPARQQHRIGHVDLYDTSFETFERKIRDQLARILSSGGFDPARDIEAITVNRWPHGYGYEYNPLWDPEWAEADQPCVIGRRTFGRIAIANTDAAATAYADSSMDQAHRAVQELPA